MADIAAHLQAAFRQEKECDVVLKLKSQNELKCHSLILRLTGEFFSSLFSENWRGKEHAGQRTIDCTAFEDEVVVGMVDFMYGINCTINERNVDDYLSCATYFGVADLKDKCEEFLSVNLSYECVFKVLILSDKYTLQTLYKKCIEFVDYHFEEAVAENEDFFMLHLDLLLEIIKRHELSVNEEFLFDQIILWVQRNNGNWNHILKYVRFLSMNIEYFVSKCVHLPLNEKCKKILVFLTSLDCRTDELEDLGICVQPRKIDKEMDSFLLRCPSISAAPSWKADMLNGDRILLSSNSDTKMKGISIFGAPQQSVLISVSVHDTVDNRLVEERKCRVDFGLESTAFVQFKKCVNIEAGKEYIFVLHCRGAQTYYGITGLATNTVLLKDGTYLKVSFHTAEGGHTNVNRGQFQGFLFPA